MEALIDPQDAATFNPPVLATWLNSLPHLNITLHPVDSNFDPRSPFYLESLGILGSVPAALLILTLFILLIYLLTRCCDRKPRPQRSISALKATLAVLSVLCCAALGLGLYGNDDLHNALQEFMAEGWEIQRLVGSVRNQTESIERQLLVQTGSQLKNMRILLEEPPSTNVTLSKRALDLVIYMSDNNTRAARAAADIRHNLAGIRLAPVLVLADRFENWRWPLTMATLSVLLLLCVILLVGVAVHNRCALIVFSVCGLLAVIAIFLLSSLYLSSSVALGDFCMAPDRALASEFTTSSEDLRKILRHYTGCERARANPFTLPLREAKTMVDNMRSSLNQLRPLVVYLFPKRQLDTKFSSLKNDVNAADILITSLTSLVDCRALHRHYLKGTRALCQVGLTGLALMLVSAVLVAFLLTALVWIDSHTWIYIRKRKDYHQVNEADPYLPPPAASQAIAARTLQRSQGCAPPDTPPPSYTSALNSKPHDYHPMPMHEAAALLQPSAILDGCDMRPSEHYGRLAASGAHMHHLRGNTLGRLPSHHHHHQDTLPGPNNGKYATLSKQCKTLESSDFY